MILRTYYNSVFRIKRKLRLNGIRQNQLAYQGCYSIAMEAYLYGIHQCALCNYEHAEFYIKKMINLAIIWGLAITQENKIICRENGFKQVELDALDRPDKWY